MSKETDKAVESYVATKMPKPVKKALADAKYDLHYGPGGGGMGWVKASKIVNEWWDRNMRSDLIVDDGGNVSTEHDWKKFVERIAKDRYKTARKELKAEGVDDEESQHTEYGYVTRLEYESLQSADSETQSMNETATRYDASDVRRLVLGRDWS